MTLKSDLIAAKALIDTPEKWTKGIKEGCLCAMYAVYECNSNVSASRCEDALVRALPRPFRGNDGIHRVVKFNDDPATTHADVMALFDRAIARAS